MLAHTHMHTHTHTHTPREQHVENIYLLEVRGGEGAAGGGGRAGSGLSWQQPAHVPLCRVSRRTKQIQFNFHFQHINTHNALTATPLPLLLPSLNPPCPLPPATHSSQAKSISVRPATHSIKVDLAAFSFSSPNQPTNPLPLPHPSPCLSCLAKHLASWAEIIAGDAQILNSSTNQSDS